jgi:glycosyltransferase involved in cell wall biosynthesis
MKIAIVYASFYARGGAENIIIWLTAELLRRGHQVTIFTSDAPSMDADLPDAVRQCIAVHYAGGQYSSWLDWWLAGWCLRNQLQQFDVINPHNFPANIWVYFAKRFSKTFPPVVYYCQEPPRTLYEPDQHAQQGRYHSWRNHLAQKWQQDGLPVLTKIVQKTIFYTLNTLCHDPLQRRHARLDQQAVATCACVLANSQYSAAQIRARYGCAVTPCLLGIPVTSELPQHQLTQPPYFLAVTRLEPLKQVDVLIRAVAQLVHEAHRPDVQLIVIGTGMYAATLQTLVQELDVSKQVQFTGYLPDTQLHAYYRQALACLCVAAAEPFGLTALEAMWHGTPVIVANTGGLAETVVDLETGIHVTPGDVTQITAALLTLLDHPERAQTMGQRGQQRVLQEFTFTHYVDRMEAVMTARARGVAP